jgi:lipopolysaccharide export system ATP-binding protein
MNLSIENIKKSYDEKMAVDDISFEIDRGETVGILGPNGAGKTTLFYIIAGLIRCDEGRLSLSGTELKNKSISERTSMGLSYLPQESSIFRSLSVKQNIFAALEQRKDLNQEEKILKLSELLEEFNLKEFSKTLGIKLSGGERRRTEIARSLASNPKFILLDEPFAGIDPIAVSDLKNTIRSLNKKNIGVLISDHNVRDTMNICSKVLVVNKGKIIASGLPEEIAKDDLVREVYLGQNFISE